MSFHLPPAHRITHFFKGLCRQIALSALLPGGLYAFAQSAPSAGAGSTPAIVQPGAPGQPSKTLPADTKSLPLPKATPADISFMQGMIMHHGQAVEMTALIATHSTDPAVLDLGHKISLSQTEEMQFMKRWLTVRNQPTDMSMPGMPDMDMSGNPMPLMPGMLSPAQMEALRNAKGPQFDHLFLTGMIQHHTGALTMVDDLFKSPGAGQDADLFNFATDVDNTQRAEIRIMQNLVAKESPASPATKKETR
jgi:uncharacterized protein (DUF305 family)